MRGIELSSGTIVGNGCKLSNNVFIGGNTKIGDYTAINRNTIIDYAEIGNFCSKDPNCHIGPGNHAIEYISTSQRLYSKNNIGVWNSTSFNSYKRKSMIGNDVWIGTGVVIMQGVTVGMEL